MSSAVEVFTVTRRLARSEWRVRFPSTARRTGSLIRYGDGPGCKPGALRSSPSSILGRPTISALPTGNGHFENRIVDVMRRASSRVLARAPCAPGRLVRQQILNLLEVGSIPTARTQCRRRSVVSSRLLTGLVQVRLLPTAPTTRAVGLVARALAFQAREASSILAPHSTSLRCAEAARRSLKLSKTVRIRPPDPSFGRARESRIDSESIARRFDSFRPNHSYSPPDWCRHPPVKRTKGWVRFPGSTPDVATRSAALVSASDCKSEMARLDSAADLRWRCRLMVGCSILNRETAGSIPPSVTMSRSANGKAR